MTDGSDHGAAFTATAAEAGERLDTQLGVWLDDSRSQAARHVDAGRVRLNGAVGSRSDRLSEGDRVEVDEEPDTSTPAPAVPPVVHEDDDLLVVDKPAGLVVHPGSGRPDGTLVDALRAAGVPLARVGDPERPGIVHRLDLGTSGLMLVAKSVAAHEGLTRALRRREVERRYLALAAGRLPAPSGRIEVPLGRDPHLKVRFTADPEGRRAVTHWRVLDEAVHDDVPVSLVACRLETGRTHQIRAHLRHVDAPVVGDSRYDGPTEVADVEVGRPLLHAARLAFDHPVTGVRLVVHTDPPADLVDLAATLGLDLPPVASIWGGGTVAGSWRREPGAS